MEIISESSSFSREAREEKGESGGALFLWTLAIIVLIGLNAFSWIFCMYVFGNPEEPFNYNLLQKLERIDPLVEYTRVSAPRGKFFTAKELYAEQYGFEDKALGGFNRLLLRMYLKNFTIKSDAPPEFIYGTFKVQTVRNLTADDVFTQGLAIRAQADDFPAAYIDFVLPTETAAPVSHWKPGDVIEIDRGDTCAYVVHIERGDEEKVIISAFPLVAREYTPPEETVEGENKGLSTIQIRPPSVLNLASSFPLSNEPAPIAIPVTEPLPEGIDDPAAE